VKVISLAKPQQFFKGHLATGRIDLVDFADFLLEQALGKFPVGGVEAVLKNLALVSVAGIIDPA
jgi:hypothetical protein